MKGYRLCNLLHVHDVVYGITGLEFTTYFIAAIVLCFSEYNVLLPISILFFFITLSLLYGSLKQQVLFYIPYILLVLVRIALFGLLFAHFGIYNVDLVERYVGAGGSFVRFYKVSIFIALLFILNVMLLLCLIYDVIYVWKRPKKPNVLRPTILQPLDQRNSLISNPESSKTRGRNLYVAAPIIIASVATEDSNDDKKQEDHVERDEQSQHAPYLHDSLPLDEITRVVDLAATRISSNYNTAWNHETSPTYEFGSSSSQEFDNNYVPHNTFENTDTMSATSYYYDTQSNFDPSRYEQ